MALCIHTVGHSNRSAEELVALLAEGAVALLVDVRRYPGSRRHPHFRRAELAATLAEHGVDYRHEPDLGGHRQPLGGARNAGQREPAFRGYADHMQSAPFRAALERLRDESRRRSIAVMCAEADPAHCHRKLLSDQLVADGARVVHLLGPGSAALHRPARGCLSAGGIVTYPADAGEQLPLFEG